MGPVRRIGPVLSSYHRNPLVAPRSAQGLCMANVWRQAPSPDGDPEPEGRLPCIAAIFFSEKLVLHSGQR